VTCHGTEAGKRVTRTYGLFDRTDPATGATSMARTTGFPCTIAARFLADGSYRSPGVHPPEHLGTEPRLFEAFRSGLAAKGIDFFERSEPGS
jgi:saccharopine dehydrogenase-like NADP-dependent oxidoreductase